MCSADDDKDASKPKAANKFSSDEDSDEDDDDEEDSREMTGRIYTKAGLEVTILMGLTDLVFWLYCRRSEFIYISLRGGRVLDISLNWILPDIDNNDDDNVANNTTKPRSFVIYPFPYHRE